MCHAEWPGRENDSFRKSYFTTADRGAPRRPPGRPRPQRARAFPLSRPALQPASAHSRGRARALGRRRRAPGPRSRRCRGGLIPAARRPSLPQREDGRRPRLRCGGGSVDKTFLSLSASHWLRLLARRGRNKRAPLPAGAGHCATSSGRDGRPASRRASLASPALSRTSFRPPPAPPPRRALPRLRYCAGSPRSTPPSGGGLLVARAQSVDLRGSCVG